MPPSQACQGHARAEYAAGATWHDLHAFASACRRDREERRRRAAPRSAQCKFGKFYVTLYCSIVDITLRNESVSVQNFDKHG